MDSPPPVWEVTCLGVDDWAMRRGHRYGTILVDLESHKPIELLPDREALTFQRWLKKRPMVKIITRDRSLAYADGALKGAPTAIQIADRFHLVKNMAEAVERILVGCQKELKEAAKRVSPHRLTEMMHDAEGLLECPFSEAEPTKSKQQQLVEEGRRQRRIERYEAVKRMSAEKMPIAAIARKLSMHRETVRRFQRAKQYPERVQGYRKPSVAARFDQYLKKRWQEGCYNANQLYREIRKIGYRGGLATLRRYMQRWRKNLPEGLQRLHCLPEYAAPRPRQAVWMLLKQRKELEKEEREYVEELIRLSPKIRMAEKLAKEFQRILRERKEEDFDQWRIKVKSSGLVELKGFSDGLMKDEEAVRAAMKYEWSNGQTEGQVNRLKMVKRQMFGRANFNLLRSRFLHPI